MHRRSRDCQLTADTLYLAKRPRERGQRGLNITMVKAEERFDNIAFSTELVEGMASSLHTVYVCPQCEEKIAFQKRNFECSLSKTHRSNLTIEVASCFDAFAQENLKRDSPFLDWICPGCGTAARVYVEFWAGGRHGDSGINLLTVIEAMPKKTPWRVVHI